MTDKCIFKEDSLKERKNQRNENRRLGSIESDRHNKYPLNDNDLWSEQDGNILSKHAPSKQHCT